MRRLNESPCEGKRRGHDSLHAELIEEDEGAADVDERVERAELVEVYVVGGTPWMPPSTSARRWKASRERMRARSGRSAASTMPLMSP